MSVKPSNKTPRFFAVDSLGRVHIHDEVEQLKKGTSDVLMDYSQIWVSSFFERYGDINDWPPVFEIEYEDTEMKVGDWSDPVDGVVLRCTKIGERYADSFVELREELLRVTLVQDPLENLDSILKVGYEDESPHESE